MSDWTTTPPEDALYAAVAEVLKASKELRSARFGKALYALRHVFDAIPTPGADSEPCSTCGGSGKLNYIEIDCREQEKRTVVPCPDCQPSAGSECDPREQWEQVVSATGCTREEARAALELERHVEPACERIRAAGLSAEASRSSADSMCPEQRGEGCPEVGINCDDCERWPGPGSADSGETCGDCEEWPEGKTIWGGHAIDCSGDALSERHGEDEGYRRSDDPACPMFRSAGSGETEPFYYARFDEKKCMTILSENEEPATKADLAALREDVEEHCATATDLEELDERVQDVAKHAKRIGATAGEHDNRLSALEQWVEELGGKYAQLVTSGERHMQVDHDGTDQRLRKLAGIVVMLARFYSSGNSDKMPDVIAAAKRIAEGDDG